MLVPDLPGLEHDVLDRWAKARLTARSASRESDGAEWSLLSEPAPAAGVPSLSYLRAQTISDICCRLRSMQGYAVRHRQGWACHGQGVEIAVARELGLTSTAEVLSYGVGPFVARCRESALRHVASRKAIAERLGCSAGPRCSARSGASYLTMDPGSIETVWSCLRQLFDAGALVRDDRVCRYCPRCRTQLAEHELSRAGVFAPVAGLTVIAKLELAHLLPTASAQLLGAELLVSTHSPWILPASIGVAVDPARTYALARRAGHGERVVLAEDCFASVLGDGWHIAARFSGAELCGASCRAIWRLGRAPGAAGLRVVLADPALANRSGTGIAPFAPRYGAGQTAALSPESELIGQDGCFDAALTRIGGLLFADAGPAIAEYLAERDALFAAQPSVRRRPLGWRCGTLLLSATMPAWYLKVPAAGEWIVSRSGYWGSPLPIWVCDLRHATCVSSLAELSALAGRDLAGLDPHRPDVDQIEIRCRQCGRPARRAPEIIDPALEAAALALDNQPTAGAAPQELDRERADGAAAQALDSERAAGTGDQPATVAGARVTSWRYALASLGAVTGSSPALVAASSPEAEVPGSSRGPGTLIEPWPLLERYGADALRWHFATSPRCRGTASDRELSDVTRTVLLPFWNCAALYASRAVAHAGREPGLPPLPPRLRPALDRWLLSELQTVVAEVTAAFESDRSDLATRRLQRFLTTLTRWYARQWKRRLTPEHQDADSADMADVADVTAGLGTFRECLVTLTCLLAPVVPFIADNVWDLVRYPDAPDSAHLASWPLPADHLIDAGLQAEMRLIRQVVRAGRAARAASGIAVRQPLSTARVAAEGFADVSADLRAIVASELNVRDVELASPAALAALSGWVTVRTPTCAVSLDPAIDDDLRRAGLVRVVRRAIQRARQAAGLAADDVIILAWRTSDPQLADALVTGSSDLGRSVRAAEFREIPHGTPAPAHMIEQRGTDLRLRLWLAPSAPVVDQPADPTPALDHLAEPGIEAGRTVTAVRP